MKRLKWKRNSITQILRGILFSLDWFVRLSAFVVAKRTSQKHPKMEGDLTDFDANGAIQKWLNLATKNLHFLRNSATWKKCKTYALICPIFHVSELTVAACHFVVWLEKNPKNSMWPILTSLFLMSPTALLNSCLPTKMPYCFRTIVEATRQLLKYINIRQKQGRKASVKS